MTEEIKREYVFGTYCAKAGSDSDDLVFIKEYIHRPDGTITPNLRSVYNYERNFYVTRKEYRDHEQKKEFEYIQKLEEYKCTQTQMVKKAARILGNYGLRRLSEVNESPYIYGTDITTPVLIHHEYNNRWPGLCTPSTLAVMDYETNVLMEDDKSIICGCISFKDKICVAVVESFVERFKGMDVKELIQEKFIELLGEYKKSRNITLEIEIVPTPEQVVIELFKRAHKWQMDFLGFWNMSFDIVRILETLEKANIDPRHVFCDPSLPDAYRYFHWKLDLPQKMKSDGTVHSKHVADLWHAVTAPASFYCVDQMCLFKRLRVGKKQRNSYSLDAILKEELNITKLKFNKADHLSGLDYHIEMQSRYPIEYIIYNIFDCISVELLDEHTGDVAKGLRATTDISEIKKLNSNPKRLSDVTYFILKNEGKVIGSVPSTMVEPLDDLTFNKNGWIITLPAELQQGTGRNLIQEYPALETNVITHSFDIDIDGAYPTFEILLNISKDCSKYEVYEIEGLTEKEARAVGINLSAPQTNSIEIARKVYGFPSLDELYEEFMKT